LEINETNIEIRTKQRFNNANKNYNTDTYYWRSKTAEIINEFLKPNINDVILDLGCGTGKQLIHLSPKIKLAIGIDISDGMIERAQETVKCKGIRNIEFYLGTFEEPNLNVNVNKKGVTKIISNYALHHLTTIYKQQAIKKMINVGGETLQRIIIGDLIFFDNPNSFKDQFHLVGYNPEVDFPSCAEELVDCFSNFGFTVEIHKLHSLVGIIVANKNITPNNN